MASYPAKCIHRFVSFEGKNTLDSILTETKIPKDFSLLSIDIDGNDIHIWDSIKRYRPKLIVIEFNPTIANETEFVQPKDMSVNQGCSVLSLVKLGKEKGYELIATTLNNAFFVDQKYFALFGIQDNSLSQLRTDFSRVTYIFNGYDGHVFVRGYGKLDLYYIPYTERRMQLIPTFLQGWNLRNPVKRFLQRMHSSLRKRNII